MSVLQLTLSGLAAAAVFGIIWIGKLAMEELEADEAPQRSIEGPHFAGYGIDITDHMAAEYRYEQAQQHA